MTLHNKKSTRDNKSVARFVSMVSFGFHFRLMVGNCSDSSAKSIQPKLLTDSILADKQWIPSWKLRIPLNNPYRTLLWLTHPASPSPIRRLHPPHPKRS